MKLHIIVMTALIAGAAAKEPTETHNNHINNPANTGITTKDTIVRPIVTLEKTMLKPMKVLYINDTANMSGLSKVFEKGYKELFTFAVNNQLKPGKVLAFYYTYSDPISLEVAIEIDKIPSLLAGRILSKMVDGGDAVIAHYTGPYEQLELPYNAIAKWLKDNNRKAKGLPFESYLNDPAMVKDKYELKTDVYQLLN